MRKSLKGFILLSLIVALTGCAGAQKNGGEPKSPTAQPAKAPKAAPVISQSYASPQLAPGKNWKIYLKASDADGDMRDIVATVTQPGMGTYPPSFIRLGENHRKEVSGYVYLLIPLLNSLDNVGMTASIQIRDQSGQFSQPVNLPLTIGFLAQEEPPPPGVFQETDLGPILIDLRTPGDGEMRGPFFRR